MRCNGQDHTDCIIIAERNSNYFTLCKLFDLDTVAHGFGADAHLMRMQKYNTTSIL